MKDYYTIKQLAEMLGVHPRTMQYTLKRRNTWSAFLERQGRNGKNKERFLRLFEINRENAIYRFDNSIKAHDKKRAGKFGSFGKESINVIARRQKEEELRQIEGRIAKLEAEMADVVFDRYMNSKLQALYIKRRCVREWLCIKDEGIIEGFYL